MESEIKIRERQIGAFEMVKANEKIVSINMVLKRDLPTLEAIREAFDINNILVKRLDMNYAEDLDAWVVNAFLDLSKSHYEESELEVFLRRLACVEQLKVSKGQRIVHQTLFPIMNGKERLVLYNVERMHFIRSELERILTPAGVAVIFYNMGLENGRAIHKMFTERLESGLMTTEQRLELFRRHHIAIGVGIFDFTGLDGSSGLVRMYDDYECDGVKKDRPECHQARGLLSGFLGSEWKTDKVKVVELRCRAIGDLHCEFAIEIKK